MEEKNLEEDWKNIHYTESILEPSLTQVCMRFLETVAFQNTHFVFFEFCIILKPRKERSSCLRVGIFVL